MCDRARLSSSPALATWQKARSELDGVLADLQSETAAGEATWREIFCVNQTFRNVVVIGCGVQFAQIITGINGIVSFSGTMFVQLGVEGVTNESPTSRPSSCFSARVDFGACLSCIVAHADPARDLCACIGDHTRSHEIVAPAHRAQDDVR